jgi:hypothetical protein
MNSSVLTGLDDAPFSLSMIATAFLIMQPTSFKAQLHVSVRHFSLTAPQPSKINRKLHIPALEQWRGKRLFVSIAASEGSASTWNSHWKSYRKSYWMASF